jgi:hypothetical protein
MGAKRPLDRSSFNDEVQVKPKKLDAVTSKTAGLCNETATSESRVRNEEATN